MSLFKMLIVDDEELARYAFVTLITRNFPDIRIVGEAENGIDAVEMARTQRPDIIAMDIKMPGINGIEASQLILNEFPDTNILILTAYDNFNYIQTALDIGVKGYLLKPFNKQEVVDKINKISNSIGDNKTNLKEQVENKIKIIRPFIQKELISAIVGGNADIEEFKSYSNFLQEKVDSGYFMLISFGHSHTESINNSVRNRIFKDKILNVLERHLSLMKRYILGNSMGNFVVVFFPCEGEYSESAVISESLVIGQEIKRRIMVIAGIDSAIGIGNPYRDIKNLKKSYNEAYTAVHEAIRDNTFMHYNSCLNKPAKVSRPYPLALENELLEELRIGNVTKARELVNALVAELSGNCADTGVIKDYVGQFISILKRALFQLGIGLSSMAGIGILAETSDFEEQEVLVLWCKNAAFSLIELLEPVKQFRDVGKVKKAQEYVNKYFYRDITLEVAAEEAGLSPQYLSKVFKEETGMNFVEYITEKRINYAKKLLKSEGKNIKEISIEVGYLDVNYFCRLFKKTTGVTPKQFKNRE